MLRIEFFFLLTVMLFQPVVTRAVDRSDFVGYWAVDSSIHGAQSPTYSDFELKDDGTFAFVGAWDKSVPWGFNGTWIMNGNKVMLSGTWIENGNHAGLFKTLDFLAKFTSDNKRLAFYDNESPFCLIKYRNCNTGQGTVFLAGSKKSLAWASVWYIWQPF
ncbi:MAG: hypothetical protein ACRERU_05715 [Methylococcales bacterium]